MAGMKHQRERLEPDYSVVDCKEVKYYENTTSFC